MKLEALRAEALSLPDGDRVDLAYELIRSLDEGPDDSEYERLWREEIERRIQAVEEGTAEFLPAEEVIASIRAKFA